MRSVLAWLGLWSALAVAWALGKKTGYQEALRYVAEAQRMEALEARLLEQEQALHEMGSRTDRRN